MNAPFIKDSFLLRGRRALELYQTFARDLPIIDFHNHLPVKDLALDRRFQNLFEIWLEGDHYKWRAMRGNGIDERCCTGDAPPYEKFLAFARTVPQTLRNPLYHWTHLELKRYFGIDELLDEKSAPHIWERANQLLGAPELSARGILNKFKVVVACTTDDPATDLGWHRKLRDDAEKKIGAGQAAEAVGARVLPTFRPDPALGVDAPETFNRWLDRLAQTAELELAALPDLLEALERRALAFHQLGCRLSDHGLDQAHADFVPEADAARVFAQARAGHAANPEDKSRYASFLMLFLGRLYARLGWTMQLHLGAMRNNNSRRMRDLGPDTGFDTIGDRPQAAALARFLDRLDQEQALPKTIVYNINPADNYVFGTMLGAFQDGAVPGKIQLGSGWWFLDQKQGMEWQLDALSNLGLLSRFVGMVTDSRSFMSFPRHEYFRRVLVNLLARDLEAGELPDDDALIGPLIQAVCFHNARTYLGL